MADGITRFGDSDSDCGCCRNPVSENIEHIFNSGDLASFIWNYFGNIFGLRCQHMSLRANLSQWWVIRPNNIIVATIMKMAPIVIIWVLWKARCGFRYGNKKSFFPKLIFSITKTLTILTNQYFPNLKANLIWDDIMSLTDKRVVCKKSKVVLWNKPPINYYKLNSNESFKEGKGGGGGIVRDWNGKLIMAFSIPLGSCSSNLAIAKALLFGLQWCMENNMEQLVLESDSLLLTIGVQNQGHVPWQIEDTVAKIRQLMIEKDCSIGHCFRKVNMVADKLANFCHRLQQQRIFVYFEDTPKQVSGLIILDKLQVHNLRIRNKKNSEVIFNDII
ncbi:uncharacterized protein LOC132624623 [Lycium barbarum]|uniref:uncharacterized protein LOC132624623 n=1 Tax=Lycium barbarum TaxID=112863 RepID=UPI00293F2FDF|nr:uncharacterized protein LOC132624623 [Lycium barbarum]